MREKLDSDDKWNLCSVNDCEKNLLKKSFKQSKMSSRARIRHKSIPTVFKQSFKKKVA